ncbi:hypothetical protein AB2M62_05165 [Sphingomonas sp. MMS12-HWE2-04]|uniref:hypothetical protein n=1 Tax=Sphingomonas sp. MMS12-HWE2-04 TaxID=3234199 RepID=UPI00385085CF
MERILCTGLALLSVTPAAAQEIRVKPLAEVRLRGEHTEQDGLAQGSEAVTARVRAGVSAIRGRIGALVEAEGTVAIGDHYYDGLHGAATRPLIADPETIGLYRAQFQYRDKQLVLTAGRQRIMLDDERFVGGSAFRQNGQAFDAVRAEWTPSPKLKADITYAWSVRTVWGVDGQGARPTAISGDNVFANLAYATSIGTLTGFAYLIDQDEAAVQGFRLSSQSYGVRFAGTRPLAPHVKLSYAASFARQSAYRRNPNDYAARYYQADAALDIARVRIGATYEVLGASNGVALTSFQMPVGTSFRFQGWASKFAPNPPDGVRDLFGTLGYNQPAAGRFKALTLLAQYHRFESDRLSRHYGNEIDLLASAKLGRYTLAARYADYGADRFATDTRKAWLQLDWAW